MPQASSKMIILYKYCSSYKGFLLCRKEREKNAPDSALRLNRYNLCWLHWSSSTITKMNIGPACADSYCCWKFDIYSSFTKRTVLPQTTQDNDNYEQTPAVVFLHTAHAKRISLLCYRYYTVYNNETFVFNLKSMVKWLMSHFWVIGWACCIELRKNSNKHSHVYHQNHDIFHYNQTLNDAVLYQTSLQSDLGLAALLQCCWFSEMVSVFHILSDSTMFPKHESETLADGNVAINKINHQMIYTLTFLGDTPHVFYEQRT